MDSNDVNDGEFVLIKTNDNKITQFPRRLINFSSKLQKLVEIDQSHNVSFHEFKMQEIPSKEILSKILEWCMWHVDHPDKDNDINGSNNTLVSAWDRKWSEENGYRVLAGAKKAAHILQMSRLSATVEELLNDIMARTDLNLREKIAMMEEDYIPETISATASTSTKPKWR